MATKAPADGGNTSAVLAAPSQVVQDYPISSTLVVFGIGIGVGLLASYSLLDSVLRPPPPTMTERLSRQFYDALSHAVPESLAKRFAA